ncbi:MAG TPA: 3-oxoacyl-[acyl-carrier-protein] synthase III C-terminal domain-containing protein [Gammaproteobacteria bacterium]|nr:3-oxoacyl-[acyl-carrier-protein] synthase III C-terminal domain-containing protein [Gammaproteobacteria bacterium]
MFVRGLGTAHPARRYTKAECLTAFQASSWFDKLDRRARTIAEVVLLGDNGINARHLALDSLEDVFAIDPDTLHARFLAHAPQLAADAGAKALLDANIEPGEIDAIVVSTCTGYLCPGLSGYVVERLGLRANLAAFDLVGHGCAAALPNWQLADALLASRRCQNVLSVCVEVSSAALYLDNDPGVLVSACLFGDGAGATVLSNEANPDKRSIECKTIGSLLNTGERAALRFEQRSGMLRNVLTRPVPKLAAAHAQRVLDDVLGRSGIGRDDIAAWIWHAGGRDVLLALRSQLGLTEEQTRYSAATLREFGNLSSAFVYFVLEAALADRARGGWWWMSSFGAGFSCHGALLNVA